MLSKICVLVSGGGTNLQALIDAKKRGNLKNCEIDSVIASNKDAFALKRAKENKIKTYVFDKKMYKDNKDFEEEIKKAILENNIDLIVLAGFMHILSSDFVKCFENRIINVHPSLIPAFCGEGFYGLKVHKAALDYGVKITGATVHFVNEVTDGGKIILQKAVDILETDTPETLQKRVMQNAEHIILPKAVELVINDIRKGKL